jgi:signal transduction histidine kinase/ligand-binding sensor domain-containing protein/DNA-binding response OmpR family regulator
MIKKFCILIAIVVFFSDSFAWSQDSRFNHIIIDNPVYCMAMDSMDILWMGTEEGLIRYDSKNLKYYHYEPRDSFSLLDNSVRSILIDSKERIWLGTRNGLNLYNREKDNFIRFLPSDKPDRSGGDFITSIVEDRDGFIWISTETNGLSRLDPEAYEFTGFKSSNNPSSIISNNIERVTIDESGDLWLGTREGIDYFDINSGEIIHYYKKENISTSLQDNDILTLDADENGRVWISGRNGYLSCLDRNDEFHWMKIDFTVTAINAAGSKLYLGTDRGKLFYAHIDSISEISELQMHEVFPGTAMGIVRSIFIDNWDNIWTGPENGLFVRYSKARQFTGVGSNSDKLPMSAVRDILIDSKGNQWMIKSNDAFLKKNGKMIRVNELIRSGNQSGFKDFYTLFEDYSGFIWFGTFSNGLFRFDPLTGRLKNYRHNPVDNKSLPHNCIWAIEEDGMKNLWIGSWGGGLIHYDREKDSFTGYQSTPGNPNSLSNDKIICLTLDSEGIIWIGTDGGGLNRFNPLTGNFINFTSDISDQESLTDNSITAIFEDSSNRLWIGTDGGGLLLMDRKDYSFKAYSSGHGLINGSVKGILEDREGKLWLSTNGGGIFMFIPEEERFIQFTKDDGLSGNRFYSGSATVDEMGNFYFGGMSGYTIFNPLEIDSDNLHPEIFISGISINNEDVSYTEEYGLQAIQTGNTLVFKPSQRIFTIDFSAVEYSHSNRNRYRYKILGYINEWNYLGEKASISFMNLPSGNYDLLIQGSNMDGIWNLDSKSIKLQILPPFYRTPWFILSSVFMIISLVILWNRMRMRELRERQRILQETVDERTKEVRSQALRLAQQNAELELQKEELAAKNEKILKSRERLRVMTKQVHEADEMKLRFFTNISHEFRTPLTLILGPLENLIQRFKYEDHVLDHLLTMRRNAGRLLRLIGQIMEFRKIDTGKLKLRASYSDISAFAKSIIESFKEYTDQKQIELIFHSEPEGIKIYFDEDKMDKILYNLLSNAIRFTSSGGKVVLSVSESDPREPDPSLPFNVPTVRIRISDTGRGIPADEIDHIFERFYQVKNPVFSGEKGGAGVGLALSKSLISLHKGLIEVQSTEGKGSAFDIYLPVGKSHLQTDEIIEARLEQITGDSHLYNSLILNSEIERGVKDNKEDDDEDKAKEKIKILLIEDSQELRKYLLGYFSKYYKVIEASDGRQGLSICKSEYPDIVISDIIMPEMDGLELCNKLKNDPDICHIPVILLTAKVSDEDKIEGLEKEADAYITKPFSPVTLQKTVENLLENRRKLQEKYRRDILLEPEELKLESNEEVLLRKAMKIVEANISNPDFNVNIMSREIGVSRAALYRKLKALTNQSVNVFVRNIRLKRAAQLLEQNKVSVSEVAYMVGYNDVQYFRKCFTKQYNATPTQYAEKFSQKL